MQTWSSCFFSVDLHTYSVYIAVGSFWVVFSVRAVDQQQKQLAVRFYSRWYIMRSGVGILATQIRLAMKRVVEL